jgi:Domain of unknown function (DUF4281)
VSASLLFSSVNIVALLGWLGLAAAITLKKPFWRDVIVGQIWPAALSSVYTILIIFFWAKSEGGFDSLANVQKLFTYQWAALAGWVHYLAFDLFVGAWIAKRVLEENLPRLVLIPLLPLTFLFGPIGLFGFYVARLLFRKVSK